MLAGALATSNDFAGGQCHGDILHTDTVGYALGSDRVKELFDRWYMFDIIRVVLLRAHSAAVWFKLL